MPAGQLMVVKVTGGDISMRTIKGMAIFERLEWLSLRLRDFSHVMSQFGQYLVEQHIRKQFANQGTPSRWKPLSSAYARWKTAHYGSLPILVLSGAMQGGFSFQAAPRTLYIINRVTRGQGGSKTPRWLWHQYGTSRMPARPVLQIDEIDRQELAQITQAYLAFNQSEGNV